MKRIALFALAGLLLFALFILYQLPASYVTSRLPANIVLQGVQGTIWQGEAALLTINARPVGRLNWQWQLAPLLKGQWAYQVAIAGDEINGNTRVAVGLDQRLMLSQLVMEIDGGYLTALAKHNQNIVLSGKFKIDSPALELQRGWPVAGSALITWRQAGLVGDLPMRLGSLKAEVDVIGDQLVADIYDEGGPLELKGNAILNQQRTFQVDLALRARAEADDNLRTSLQLISAPDLTGRYRFSQQGRF